MRYLNPFEKLLNSIINVIFICIVFIPFWFIIDLDFIKKIIFIILFFLHKFIVVFLNKNRSVGMIITKTYWKEDYPKYKGILHTFFYTISFSTLFFHVYFPFDIFLLNILLIQLPCMLITKSTLHEYISGRMLQIKK